MDPYRSSAAETALTREHAWSIDWLLASCGLALFGIATVIAALLPNGGHVSFVGPAIVVSFALLGVVVIAQSIRRTTATFDRGAKRLELSVRALFRSIETLEIDVADVVRIQQTGEAATLQAEDGRGVTIGFPADRMATLIDVPIAHIELEAPPVEPRPARRKKPTVKARVETADYAPAARAGLAWDTPSPRAAIGRVERYLEPSTSRQQRYAARPRGRDRGR